MPFRKIVILGAGISGLAFGFFLKQRGIPFIIFEKEERVGGFIQSVSAEGFLFEKGPRSFRRQGTGQATWDLSLALGLEKELITEDPAASIRYIYSKGALQKVGPNFTFLKALARDLFSYNAGQDESIGSYARRRFGDTFTKEYLEPMTLGIYAGDIEALSMRACFPHFYNRPLLLSLLKGRSKGPSLFSFRLGTETLTRALFHYLKEEIVLGKKAILLTPSKVEIEGYGEILADHIFSCLPSHVLSKLVKEVDPDLSDMLSYTKSESIGVVNVGFCDLDFPWKGFGYLVPSKEKEEVLGCVFDSSVFPSQNRQKREVRLSVMLKKKTGMAKIALSSLKKHLALHQLPDYLEETYRENAIPQYTVGYDDRMRQISTRLAEKWPKLRLLGASFSGVSVNDCVAFAKKEASLLT